MASSGSFTGARGGNSYSPYLRLDWNVVQTDIANNRSKVKLSLVLVVTNPVYFSASKSGNLHGSSFTYTGGFSGTGSRTLQTKEVWVGHNSDGSKSQSFSASFNIAITFGGSWIGNMSVSGTASLNTIPRASTITSFSMSKNLQTTTGNSISLGISRASSSFTHDIQLRIGSTVIASWNGQGLPTSLSVTASQVNDLMNRIQTSDRATITLRVQTKNGSTNIGSAVTRNSTVWIDGSVVPVASGLSVAIAGNGRDKAIGKYVQSISKVTASFSPSARGYAYLVSNQIFIRKVGGVNNTVIHGSSGTSAVLGDTGTYEAVAETVDSRGRKATQRVTFTVEAYTTPRITSFSAVRVTATPTTVNVLRAGNHSALGGSNLLTIQISRRVVGGTWAVINAASTTGTASTFNSTVTSTGNAVTSSYEFRVLITDSFGNKAESTQVVSTSRVVLSVNKNDGVGIGKIHERGVLDIDGDIYTVGSLNIVPNNEGTDKASPISIKSKDANGHGYIEYWGSDNKRKAYMGINNSTNQHFTINSEMGSLDIRTSGDLMVNGVSSGDVLWTGQIYMQEGQTATPNKKMSECPNGWVLVWSAYSNGTASNWDWHYSFVHKSHSKRHTGNGVIFPVAPDANANNFASKYLYVYDDRINGYASNSTGHEVKLVLREVLAW